MKTFTRVTSLSATFLFLAGATACNVHDNTFTANIPNATINATADANATTVAPAQQVAVTVTTANVYLIAPDATPPPEHASDAAQINVYLDNTDEPPLLVTAEAMFNVMIPSTCPAGKHKLICRVHKHDGTPYGMPTSVEQTVDIMVTASVSADGGVDVTTSVDANVTTGAGGAPATGAGGAGGAGG